MAKKTVPDANLKRKNIRRKVKVEIDKAGMAAAALGTFLIAEQVHAAEQNTDEQKSALESQAQVASAAEELPAEALATDIEQLAQELAGLELPSEELPASAELPVADLDGVILSQASPAIDLPAGVDAKTTMVDAGGSAGTGGAAAAGEGAAAASAAGGGLASAAGGFGPLVAGSIPLGAAVAGGALAAVAVAGAGGGGGGGSLLSGNPLTAIKGLVSDANVAGAKVYYDSNDDGIAQDGEQIAVTDAKGAYTASVDLTTGHKIIIKGGVDIVTGQT
ncbi:MAG: hypothetical protein JWP36_1774, partial [Paucimonas sp.]|nr:hypothetical protein [Paucimonas sp.]